MFWAGRNRQEVVPITFRVKTSHLKQGESATMHMNKDHLLQVSGVPHAGTYHFVI